MAGLSQLAPAFYPFCWREKQQGQRVQSPRLTVLCSQRSRGRQHSHSQCGRPLLQHHAVPKPLVALLDFGCQVIYKLYALQPSARAGRTLPGACVQDTTGILIKRALDEAFASAYLSAPCAVGASNSQGGNENHRHHNIINAPAKREK